MSAAQRFERFLAFSAEAAAFTPFELRGTGMAEAYLAEAVSIVGVAIVDDLLAAHEAAPAGAGRDMHLRRAIFGDARLGPVARNVIKLWYLGIWYELPRTWREANGTNSAGVTHMVSPQAYTEGLLWPAIGANPPGAKAPGFASWTAPPHLPTF